MSDELVERLAVAICRARYSGSLSHWESGGKHALMREAQAALSEIEAAGLVTVPRVPTPEMLAAGDIAGERGPNAPSIDTWSAMIAASPKHV